MKLLTGWVLSAGLVLAATSANAQAPDEIGHSRYSAGADGPYAAMPPEGRGAGSGPTLLPAREVYTVVRDNGFSALGSPHQHGDFYTISVTDRRGGEGRLVIDARDGQIVRFMRGDRMGRQPAWRCAGLDERQRRAPAAGVSATCREPHGAAAESAPAASWS